MYRRTKTYASLRNPLSSDSCTAHSWKVKGGLTQASRLRKKKVDTMQPDSGYWKKKISECNIKYESWHPASSSPDMPKELRLQAVRAAVLLLPDENREALQTLLCLLSDVTASVAENQMTPTNLAVCLAPSLFHLNTLRRKESSSPRCFFDCWCAHPRTS